jgi:hypothetical protein
VFNGDNFLAQGHQMKISNRWQRSGVGMNGGAHAPGVHPKFFPDAGFGAT